MRKISFVLVAAMLLSVSSAFANNNDPVKKVKPSESLSTQIGQLLDSNDFTENEEGARAQVLFMLNDDKEIVVLSVDTDENSPLEGFIKSKLNYQPVELGQYEAGKKYTVSVRVVI